MIKKKYKLNINKYCLWIIGLIIFTGCASQTKREDLIGIQKIRIRKLEQQLAKKNEALAKIKMKKWVSGAPQPPESVAFKALRQQIKKKQWVAALKLSAALKKKYPQSVQLSRYRIGIFRKMGLKKQAIEELNYLKKQVAKKKRKRRQI